MERGQRDLAGPGEPQIVLGELRRSLPRGRGNGPGLRNACSRAIAGTVIGVNPASAILLQRPAHQLGLEQRQPPLEAIGPRSRHLGDPARSAQSFFSISATWSSGSKSKRGAAPSVRTTMLELSSGPTGAPSHGMPGSCSISASQRRFLARRARFPARRPARPPPWPRRPARRVPRALASLNRALIALRSARSASISVLSAAHLGVERQQRVEVEVDALVADRLLDRRRGSP